VTSKSVEFDHERSKRIGIDEAVLCTGKTQDQIGQIIHLATEMPMRLLLTRLTPEKFAEFPEEIQKKLDFDEISRTAIFGGLVDPIASATICIVSAGTSDVPVATEAIRTLNYYGVAVDSIFDIGVAGLWRLQKHTDKLQNYSTIIVVSGMDGALPSVIGGLVGSLIIALPTSTGYGVSDRGKTALHAALASCAPGLVAVNIDNGYGAAIAAIRAMRSRVLT